MFVENMPFCCTASVLGSFGEHGEPSDVSVAKIRELCEKEFPVIDQGGVERGGHKRVVFAISVDPANITQLLKAGFKVIDKYQGIQGLVHVMSLHNA